MSTNSTTTTSSTNTKTTPAAPYFLTSSSPLPSFSSSPAVRFPSVTGLASMERAKTMALNNNDIMDFVGRYQTLQTYQSANDQLIKDLLIYAKEVQKTYGEENQLLKQELRNAKLDLEHATISRREMQQTLSGLESDNNYLKHRNPYVVILIDGDGLLFQEHYIKMGIEGGKQAAYALRSAVAEYVGSQAGEVEIIAKVCANMSGLGRAMRRDGCLDSESELKDFSLGFTQAKASFDFVDVGHGKERADSKIKEATRWHLRNYNCRQILLGISHDAGYAPFLDEILQDKESRSRVCLIEGIATVRELKNTSVHILEPLPSLFRNQKLIDRSGDRSAESTYFKPSVVTTSPTLAVSPPASAPASSSWAGVTKASPPPQITTPLANKNINLPVRQASQPKAQQSPAWNPGERGLDPTIPINQVALENIKKRTGASKLCNNHYLRGPCAKGDECCFEHNYRPNNDEINAIALLTRLNPCTSGQECDVDNCIYGHHCPSVVGNTCTHPYCKFRISDHPPGTKFKNSKIHEN
ncbi:c-x8-c-x5-c-x3-h zinc finger protein [Colletotrichum karsti]|uniref:C-x8-c-x5-c-x3-h zinc finger protein n=1 Tax=Colletotrichum karsti TaxID=1095194 RepID=A0A9P6HUG2_9PEZI|nr:c-x8-c-x5-c-x3-h zinc finger protein [Colletotrichum karsti]KAF9870504.1 c-x8-c-x5-c-x3-h zinc finger protein [Colletotrichum karsti]